MKRERSSGASGGEEAAPPDALADGEAELAVFLFGGFRAVVRGYEMPRLRSRSVQYVLALLALRRGRPVERDWLAGTLWPDSPQALYNLSRNLTDLRHALGADAARLSSPTRDTLLLSSEGVFVDVLAFDAAVKQGDAPSLEEAITLYRGPLLAGCGEGWVVSERVSREQAYHGALEALAALDLEAGRATRAAERLRRLLREDPARESACRGLMRALAATGDYGAVTQAYRDLRAYLHDELRTSPCAETQSLYRALHAAGQARAGSTGFHESPPSTPDPIPMAVAPRSPAARIPTPLTPLVGREAETKAVRDLLCAARLVTLTGIGGVGKTRLAIRVARVEAADFDDVYFCDLTSLQNPGLLPQAVAAALGVREESGRDLGDVITAAIGERLCLLVLDNCEHLLDACARAASAFLTACPRLRILAASRQALGVTGEATFAVPPLGLPDDGTRAADAEAVRLFAARAHDARPGFTLTDDKTPAVVEICRRLDALPLALELAAARTRVFSVQEIAARLDDPMTLLVGGDRSKPARYQTLRGALDWSYGLLTPGEQRLLRRLSVFSGGTTLDAAEALLTGLRPGAAAPVPELLTGLVEKSLVIAEAEQAPTRFRLLESVRQYARERLEAEGEAAEADRRHAAYFAAFAERGRVGAADDSGQAEWLERMEREQDNLRAALAWAVGNAPAIGLHIASALSPFWVLRGGFAEGRGWLERVLAVSDGQDPEARVLSYGNAAYLAFWSDDSRSAVRFGAAGRMLAREAGVEPAAARAAAAEAMGHLETADGERAAVIAAEGLALSRRGDDLSALLMSLVAAGVAAVGMGQLGEAAERFDECFQHATGAPYDPAMPMALYYLSGLALLEGDPVRAETLAAQGLERAERIGFRIAAAHAAEMLGRARASGGDAIRSLPAIRQSHTFLSGNGQTLCLAHNLEAFARVARAVGDVERAVRLLAGAQAVVAECGYTLMPIERILLEQSIQEMESDAPADVWQTAMNVAPEEARETAFALIQPQRTPPRPSD